MTVHLPKPDSVQIKLDARINSIADLARKIAPNCADVFSILADAERALKRAAKRMEEVSAEYERVEFVQTNGPRIEFTGRRIAFTTWQKRDGKASLEIWQTEAGALVAVEELTSDGDATLILQAEAIPSTLALEDARIAVLDFFGWGDRARRMVQRIGWSTRRDID